MASDMMALAQALLQKKAIAAAKSQMFGFVGPSYTSASMAVECERSVNLYVERVESGMGKNSMYLRRIPGLRPLTTLPKSPTRGGFFEAGVLYVVAGNGLYAVDEAGGFVHLGAVADDGKACSFAHNGRELLVASGGDAYLYSGGVFKRVVEASRVEFIDGYFLAITPNSRFWRASDFYDGSTWSGLRQAEWQQPDIIKSVVVAVQEIWLQGDKHTEVWQSTGQGQFPFARIQGAVLDQGAASVHASDRLDNTIFWLGADARGRGIAYRANGWVPVRISNHAVETAWASYERCSDAESWTYQEGGHLFWVLRFPSAHKFTTYMGYNPPQTVYLGATWVYDVSTNFWHERAFWDVSIGGIWRQHKARWHANCWDKWHVVGDVETGQVYIHDETVHSDNGYPLRWLRRTPHIATECQWQQFRRLQIDAQMGVGLTGSAVITAATQTAPIVFTVDDVSQFLVGYDILVTDSSVPEYNGAFQIQAINLVAKTVTVDNPGAPPAPFAGTATMKGPGTDPQMVMRFSDTGGRTWGNDHPQSMGKTAEFTYRAIWDNLGTARDRVFEVTGSDPVETNLIDAICHVRAGKAGA